MKKYMMIGLLLALGFSSAPHWSDPYLGYKFGVALCQASVVDGMFNHVLAPPDGQSYCVSQGLAGQINTLMDQMYRSQGSSLYMLNVAFMGTGTCYSQSGVDWACVARYRSQYLSEQINFNLLKQQAFALYIQAARGGLSGMCIDQRTVFGDYMNYWMQMVNCNNPQAVT